MNYWCAISCTPIIKWLLPQFNKSVLHKLSVSISHAVLSNVGYGDYDRLCSELLPNPGNGHLMVRAQDRNTKEEVCRSPPSPWLTTVHCIFLLFLNIISFSIAQSHNAPQNGVLHCCYVIIHVFLPLAQQQCDTPTIVPAPAPTLRVQVITPSVDAAIIKR